MIVSVIHNDREYQVTYINDAPYQVEGYISPRVGGRFGYYRQIWWNLSGELPSALVKTILAKALPLAEAKAEARAKAQAKAIADKLP